MWCTNHSVEFATALYARWKTAGEMSSMRTAEPPGAPSRPMRPSSVLRAAARSASLSAAQTHSRWLWSATEESPDTSPPAPRLADSRPSSPSVNDTGPRLDAMSTRPPAALAPIKPPRRGLPPDQAAGNRAGVSRRSGNDGRYRPKTCNPRVHGRAGLWPGPQAREAGGLSRMSSRFRARLSGETHRSGTGWPAARPRPLRVADPGVLAGPMHTARPIRVTVLATTSQQLNNAHPEGWRDRPCEAPATITVIDVPALRARGSPPPAGKPSARPARPFRDRCQLRPTARRPLGKMRMKGLAT